MTKNAETHHSETRGATTMKQRARDTYDRYLQAVRDVRALHRSKSGACDCHESINHEVPDALRRSARWCEEESVYIAPDGRAFVYTDLCRGARWRCGHGCPLLVARWCE